MQKKFFILFSIGVMMVIGAVGWLGWIQRFARASDGSGTNSVTPSTVIASTTGNALVFTFTAAETMSSGDVAVTIPSDWSTPTSTSGTAGYTTVTSGAGMIATILDTADSSLGWSAGTACTNGLDTSTATYYEGTASIECQNGNESTGNVFYKNISTQNWSGYTTIGFWIRTSAAVAANRLQFAYDDNNNLASPVAILNIPALSANTWTYETLALTGTRTSIASYGFRIAHNSALDHVNIFVDDIMIGPGVATFPGDNVVRVNLLSLTGGQTVVFTYGSGGGASGALAPRTGRKSTFLTKTRINAAGTEVALATSPTVTVANPVPSLSSISPPSKNAGDSTFTLTLIGTNFNASSTAYFEGNALPTTYVTGTQLTATVSASFLELAGTFNVTVLNPTPGGGQSNAQEFIVNNPVPVFTTVLPDSATVGDGNTTITLTGTNFVSGSIVRLDGTDLGTAYVNSTQLTATVASSSLLAAGTKSISVFNPTPGGGTSGLRMFTINNPTPTISSISPSTIEAGSLSFTLDVDGTGYATSSIVKIDGDTLTTTYVNTHHLEAAIPSSYIAVSGTHVITVFTSTPGGGTSNSSTLQVIDTTPPAITITAPTKISTTAITDTTVHVVNTHILVSNVIVDPSTTAGTSNFSCTQTSIGVVDCTIHITSSGYLVIKGTDESGNVNTATETGYRIETTPPSITITAPTTSSTATIIDTTIHVLDLPTLNSGINVMNVIVDPSTTAGTSNFSCTQTDTSTVDCTIRITSSGNLVIKATDNAGNAATETKSGYVIDAIPPSITITAPTKSSRDTISDTFIHITDNSGLSSSDVTLSTSTTASVGSFLCSQTNSKTVDCSIDVLSSGNVTIKASDLLGNTSSQSENDYVIEGVPPIITITPSTKVSNTAITDTTIHVTDNYAISAASVIVDPSTTAGTSNFSCTQTDTSTVDCTIRITSSGNLVIKATD
ncbi:MAG: hypothetical protein KGN01_08045, partial [Patescibacteria group bacterium]|nr:hypothetical protein [Patescibacteria group bacterium]